MLNVERKEIKRGLVVADSNVIIEIKRNEKVIIRIYPITKGIILKISDGMKIDNNENLQEIVIKEKNSS